MSTRRMAGAGAVHRFGWGPIGPRRPPKPVSAGGCLRSGAHPGRCFGGVVHTRAGRRPDPGADMTQAYNAVRYATLRHATYNTANTWTHTASIPRNSETDASAAASSTTARNI